MTSTTANEDGPRARSAAVAYHGICATSIEAAQMPQYLK